MNLMCVAEDMVAIAMSKIDPERRSEIDWATFIGIDDFDMTNLHVHLAITRQSGGRATVMVSVPVTEFDTLLGEVDEALEHIIDLTSWGSAVVRVDGSLPVPVGDTRLHLPDCDSPAHPAGTPCPRSY